MFRTIIIKILLRMLGRPPYKQLSKKATNNLMFNIANEEGFERFPDFLQQCADTYRNQFLYTKDERFRGAVLAFTSLREIILAKKTTKQLPKEKIGKNRKKPILTKKENDGNVKKVAY